MSETQSTTPKYFRLLEIGEMLNLGDLWVESDGRLSANHGLVEKSISTPCLRPVVVDEWIEYAKQEPTEADGPRVLVWENGKPHLWSWCYIASPISHWRRITPPTPTIRRVKVDTHEVLPQADGSVKVGCQTVSAADFEEIVRQREAAMKANGKGA